MKRLRTDGRFFRAGESRVALRAVTFGPFPGWWDRPVEEEFARISAAGFNAVRVYEAPDRDLLDAAQKAGLWVVATVPWGWGQDFIAAPQVLDEGRARLRKCLDELGDHPALAMVLVANEIPPDMVRWMGALDVLNAIEKTIAECRASAPEVLYGYASYPTTEYLEPRNADVTALNVFLEDGEAFAAYLNRLQVLAGDRPVFIGEMGLDTQRNGEDKQLQLLGELLPIAARVGVAGYCVYSWCDAWQNAGAEVTDWAFGLTRRDGSDKPALAEVARLQAEMPEVRPVWSGRMPFVSVIVCTWNGAERIEACVRSLLDLNYESYEVIVVDDGSSDGTEEIVAGIAGVRLLRCEHKGLSAARNAGAEAARGEWLAYTDDDCTVDTDWLGWLTAAMDNEAVGAIGGPNIPPEPEGWQEAAVEAMRGGPSHVLLDGVRAEHLPGCNLVIRKQAFEEIGGFDVAFQTAGDDVDVCWRLRESGWELAFVPQAFVWHRRRLTLSRYVRQQRGYGAAERMLWKKWPGKFTRSGSIEWRGVIYTGASAAVHEGAVIYHGPMGQAPYQALRSAMMPQRPLVDRYNRWWMRLVVCWVERWAMWRRELARTGRKQWATWWRRLRGRDQRGESWKKYGDRMRLARRAVVDEWAVWSEEGVGREVFLAELMRTGWRVADDSAQWDLKFGSCLVLIATEQREGKARRTLIRCKYDDESVSMRRAVELSVGEILR